KPGARSRINPLEQRPVGPQKSQVRAEATAGVGGGRHLAHAQHQDGSNPTIVSVSAIDLQAALTYAACFWVSRERDAMASDDPQSRRVFVRKLIIGAAVAPLVTVRVTHAADLPLLSPEDPEAKKVKYTEDAASQKSAVKDNNCGTCALYEGTYKSTQG